MKRKKKDVQKPSNNIKWMRPKDSKAKKKEMKDTIDDDSFYEFGLLWHWPPFVIPGGDSVDESDLETNPSEEGGYLE